MNNYSRKVQQRKERRILREDFAEWLNQYPWDWFLTATFEGEFSPSAARRAVLRYFNELEDLFSIPIPRFWVQEYGQVIEFGPHYHAFVTGVDSIQDSARFAWKLWTRSRGHGRFETKPYNPKLGADYYLTKYVVKEEFAHGDWGVDKLGHLCYNSDR